MSEFFDCEKHEVSWISDTCAWCLVEERTLYRAAVYEMVETLDFLYRNGNIDAHRGMALYALREYKKIIGDIE